MVKLCYRRSAFTLANLRSIGQGIALYVAENHGTLPFSNYYKGLAWDGTT